MSATDRDSDVDADADAETEVEGESPAGDSEPPEDGPNQGSEAGSERGLEPESKPKPKPKPEPDPNLEHETERNVDAEAPPDPETAVGDLPPSAKLVYKVLEYEGSLTQEEIAGESRLCSRTVRYALDKLEGNELVVSRVCLEDARQSKYWIPE
ncbi:hypothetical protein C446_13309 [Halobiforma nitratireducens JCM 10879]|uniref:MarR family transcriptional regulator n=1 Tax=Halobiforma nitratireducens JCM 10879 TaxID=1227454 RepID=M0LNR2_9EURY|nr:hypothetical protein C446_13309 [Halobiforma nitratireducens JCM 10879]